MSDRINYPAISVSCKAKPAESLKKIPAYIFHHIMKCGGSSVNKVLDKWFNMEYEVVNPGENINSYIKFRYNTERIFSDVCITGHFQGEGHFLHQRYPETIERKNEFRIFTFLRDPLKFRTSLYYYVRNNGGMNDTTLKDFTEVFPNYMASLIPCNEENYKKVLDRYFFIGIVEELQESMDILADLINKKKISVPFENVSVKDEQMSELNEEVVNKFRISNGLDYCIYNYCLEKFRRFKNK